MAQALFLPNPHTHKVDMLLPVIFEKLNGFEHHCKLCGSSSTFRSGSELLAEVMGLTLFGQFVFLLLF